MTVAVVIVPLLVALVVLGAGWWLLLPEGRYRG